MSGGSCSGGVPCRVGMACCFLPGFCGGEVFLGCLVWWRAVSRLTCVVASHAVLTWRSGEGGGLILPALAKSAPTLPSPPRHPGTARCAACGYAGRNAGCRSFLGCIVLPACLPVLSFFSRDPAFRCRRTRVRTGKGWAVRQSLLAACGGRLTPCPGAERSNVSPNQQSEATSAQISRARQRQPKSAERGNVSPNQQSEAVPAQPGRPTQATPPQPSQTETDAPPDR